MLGFEERNYVVTGYQAFGSRTFEEDPHTASHAVTTIRLRLDIRQDGGPPGRRATLAKIEFAAGAANRIGQILPRNGPHADQFELNVTLPVADFDPYWNILRDTGQTKLSCEVELPPGDEIAEFVITSPQDIESTSP